MVIVDTTVWIDFLAGIPNSQTAWILREADRQRIGMIDLILCEILQGIRQDSEFIRTQDLLSGFDTFDTAGRNGAIATAQNYRYLRQRGYTVRKTIDCYIATFCISGGHELLHRDRDFDLFEKHLGLRVIHP
jgi:predicted nucleic acid-binding protein